MVFAAPNLDDCAQLSNTAVPPSLMQASSSDQLALMPTDRHPKYPLASFRVMKFIDRALHHLAGKRKHRQQEHPLPDGGGKPRQQWQNLAGFETRQPLASDKAKEQVLADSESRKRLANDKTKQQESCALLKLPLELILDIADKLEPFEQVLLSQSCQALRVALKTRCGLVCLLSSQDVFGFLTCIARNRPEYFACLSHKKTCPIDYNDHPMTRRAGSKCMMLHHVTPLELADGKPYFHINYVHCQLALKTMRIFGNGYPFTRPQQHLQRLIAPHHRTVHHLEGSLTIQLSVYPRIVGDRFLLLNEWHIEKQARKVCGTEGLHGHILICRHQEYSQDAWLLSPDEVPQAGALCNVLGQLASLPRGAEVHGACASCNTDFSVRGTRNRCHIRSWQDLGPEGAAAEFRALLWTDFPMSHHPGSVRRLYEAADGRG